MRHFKIIGWLWLLFGAFWSVVAICWFVSSPQPIDSPYPVVESSQVRLAEVGLDTLEVSFAALAAIAGLGLIRSWHWARPVIGVLGGLLLAWSVCLIWSAQHSLTTDLLSLGPVAFLGLYSLIVVMFGRYESRAA
jgi:hypothetical protein